MKESMKESNSGLDRTLATRFKHLKKSKSMCNMKTLEPYLVQNVFTICMLIFKTPKKYRKRDLRHRSLDFASSFKFYQNSDWVFLAYYSGIQAQIQCERFQTDRLAFTSNKYYLPSHMYIQLILSWNLLNSAFVSRIGIQFAVSMDRRTLIPGVQMRARFFYPFA